MSIGSLLPLLVFGSPLLPKCLFHNSGRFFVVSLISFELELFGRAQVLNFSSSENPEDLLDFGGIREIFRIVACFVLDVARMLGFRTRASGFRLSWLNIETLLLNIFLPAFGITLTACCPASASKVSLLRNTRLVTSRAVGQKTRISRRILTRRCPNRGVFLSAGSPVSA